MQLLLTNKDYYYYIYYTKVYTHPNRLAARGICQTASERWRVRGIFDLPARHITESEKARE